MKKYFYFFTISIFFFSCYPTDISIGASEPEPKPKLPEITQSGNLTFGCLMNSLVWRNYKEPGFWIFSSSSSLSSQYFRHNDSCSIQAEWHSKDRNKSDIIQISFKGVSINKKVQICSVEFISTDFEGKMINQLAILDTSSTNNNITVSLFDRNQQILAGEFNLDLKSTITGKVIKLRKGRFDTHFFIW